MANPRIALTLGLVFLAGMGVGMVAMRYGLHDQLHQVAAAPPDGVLEYYRTQLSLSPEQTERLAAVLDDYRHYYQSVQEQIEDLRLREQIEDLRSTGKNRIMEILNPDQRAKFEQISKEMSAPAGEAP
jgi:hypothetical protein